MQINPYVIKQVQAQLDPNEQFVFKNEKGLPFNVSQVTYSGRTDTFGLRVFMVKADGSEGVLHRQAAATMTEIPSNIVTALIEEWNKL